MYINPQASSPNFNFYLFSSDRPPGSDERTLYRVVIVVFGGHNRFRLSYGHATFNWTIVIVVTVSPGFARKHQSRRCLMLPVQYAARSIHGSYRYDATTYSFPMLRANLSRKHRPTEGHE